MSNSPITQQLLWLDPFRSLSGPEQAQLAAAGLVAQAVATLDELRQLLPLADLIALRLEGSTALLTEVKALLAADASALPIICRVERRDLELTVAAMRAGAVHVIAADEFAAPAWQAASPRVPNAPAAAQVLAKVSAPRTVVYVDAASRHLLALAQRVAKAPVSVLIEGPTGAGKEVLARVVHESSERARGPFVALNCAALPDHLIEDMLFGHEKGAFTGAVKEHRGLFEQAQGGTIFLDEIAEMPMHLQTKLLRVLQERQLVRLGGERAIELDVRVLAATNKDLRVAMAQREFREDLYFRLSTFKLRVPALRDRPGDILPLVARLLARHAQDGRVLAVNPQAQACLQAHRWPGNVRELENVVLRAVVLCTGDVITPAHLMFDEPADMQMPAAVEAALPSVQPEPVAAVVPAQAPHPAPSSWPASGMGQAAFEPQPLAAPWSVAAAVPQVSEPAPVAEPASLQQAVQINEHQLILAAIQSTLSRMDAARKLGISPRTLRYKMAKLRVSGMALEA
ncbi:MAG: sigma 54-interacting transcriptional regulator [Betaproteobacteria bacterium]